MSTETPRLIFASLPGRDYYYNTAATCYVLSQGHAPALPSRSPTLGSASLWSTCRMDPDSVREANRTLIRRSDEVWAFGTAVTPEMLEEIRFALRSDKVVRFHTLENEPGKFRPLGREELPLIRYHSFTDPLQEALTVIRSSMATS